MTLKRLYCEHSALTKEVREYGRRKHIQLIHFSYDPNSKSKYLLRTATPSKARWCDMTMPWSEYADPWSAYSGSKHFESVLSIIGHQNRRDALHLDSAYKSQCAGLITRDSDILNHREPLQKLLGLRIFHPDHNAIELHRFIDEAST